MTPDQQAAVQRLDDICDHPRCMYDLSDESDWSRFTEAVLADIRTLLAMVPQWQPIETAPLDGTHILLLAPDVAGVPVVIEGHWDANPTYGDPVWDIAWLKIHGCGCCGDDPPEPTHWMPLPFPPARQDGE